MKALLSLVVASASMVLSGCYTTGVYSHPAPVGSYYGDSYSYGRSTYYGSGYYRPYRYGYRSYYGGGYRPYMRPAVARTWY